MSHGTRISDTNYNISARKARVNSTNYSVSSGKTRINSTNYTISFGTQIGSLAVGTSVFMNVNNVRTEFIIVHQGLPSSDYDSSCNGTWVLMKKIYENKVFDSSNNDYENSDIHSYLNGTFLNLFSNNIKNAIKQIKLPYWNGVGNNGSYQKGSNGLSTKIFLLSDMEVGLTSDEGKPFVGIGAKLSYFESGLGDSAKNKRIANYNGTATYWWLRSPATFIDYYVYNSNPDGKGSVGMTGESWGARPALVLSSTSKIDSNFNVIG